MSRQFQNKRADFTRAEPQPVVGHGAGDAEAGLRHVKTTHLVAWLSDPAAGSEVSRVGQIAVFGTEEVAVHRKNGGGRGEVGAELRAGAKGGGGGLGVVTRSQGFIDGPSGLRILADQFGAKTFPGRGGGFIGENRERGATGSGGFGTDPLNLGVELFGRGLFTLEGEMPATGGIVKIKDGGLGMVVALAFADRVKRVAFHLDRAAVESGGEERDRAAATRLGGGKGKGFSGHDPFG